MSELRIGLVGYGVMGKAHSYGYRVAPLLRRLPVTPVVTVMSGRDAGAVAAAARAYGVPDTVTDILRDQEAASGDDALVKVSAYYASLDPARPAPAPKVAAASDPLAAAKSAAQACAGCHGDNGVSATPGSTGTAPPRLLRYRAAGVSRARN